MFIYHPDVDSTSEAQERLQAVIAAYNVLSDQDQRERYDALRRGSSANGYHQGNGGHEEDTIGEDAVVLVALDFLEAALGKQHALEVSVKRTCPDCVGLGAAPGTHPIFCSLCSGHGHVRIRQTTHAGEVMAGTAACPGCGATGIVRQEWCTRCGGDGRAQTLVSVNVAIPAGVDAESVLRVKGLGDAGRNRGAPGDLYITFAVKPRAGIQRRGLDLYSDVIVKYTDAILGGSAAVATIRGEAWLPIPPGTQDGQVLTLPGAGISPGAAAVGRDSGQAGQPRQLAAGSRQRGAHHYTVVLLLPSQVSDEEHSTLQRLRQLLSGQSNGVNRGSSPGVGKRIIAQDTDSSARSGWPTSSVRL
ncbi:hypothetical protein WJX75_001548 [Coccomyxa subellipsoidea]|uniref:CR-type domain-containing protein n=1 Tax=Coccomyxa subellipsoidea TaxID=248742 RepID=A0ABR2YLX9_9CHLO